MKRISRKFHKLKTHGRNWHESLLYTYNFYSLRDLFFCQQVLKVVKAKNTTSVLLP
jgi:hypothetical protein